jgi:hypothetical protein
MADTGAQVLERGTTLYGPTATIPTAVQSKGILGRRHVSKATNPSNAVVRRSQEDVHCIIVRNSSGVTLYPGQLVVWKSGCRGTEVGSVSYETLCEVAGVVDDMLPSSGVRNGDVFNLIVKGPCLALLSRTAAEANISEGDILYAVTAATSQATTGGRFTNWVGTFTSTETEDGTILKMAINNIGRAISAATTADTGSQRLVDLNCLK